jgi:aryl-alcohol dehydrogenase-like predicted oxidoreductase
MDYRPLGRTDLKVSAICLGTMTWGLQNTQDEAFEQMNYALEQGVNFWDTAELYAVPPSGETYGKTEIMIGNWFKETGRRKDVILASKVAGPGRPWIREGKARLDRANIIEAIEGSLQRLQTDYIDLYQLHWPNRPHYNFGNVHPNLQGVSAAEQEENFLEVLDTLDLLVKEGKILHAGLSNETAWGTMKYLQLAEKHNLPRMVSIQNEYSVLCRIFEDDLSEVALMEDVGLLAYTPLVAGAISGKYLDGKNPKGARRDFLDGPSHRDTDAANAAIRDYIALAEKHGLDVNQMALAFAYSRPFMTSVIIGATSMAQLKTNIAAADLKLSSEVLEAIDALDEKYPRVF